MADPSPTVNLPDAEYIELTGFGGYIDLAGWLWVAGTDTFELPNYILKEGIMPLIVAESQAHFFPNNFIIPIKAPAGYLSNSGEYLALITDQGLVIDALTYSSTWHDTEAKKDGGWSLSQVSQSLRCYDSQNWKSNNNPNGGTPGAGNWIYSRDSLSPAEVSKVTWISNKEVLLTFAQGISNHRMPYITATSSHQPVAFNPSNPTEIRMVFINPIGNQPISIYVRFAPSCSGYYQIDTLTFSSPETPEMGDVVLNEVLFNPAGEVQDFVEIWNVSQKTLLLGEIGLANLDESGNAVNQFPIGAENTMLLPGQFLVVTEDVNPLCEKYHCPKLRFFSETATPSMPDAGAHIGLVKKNLEVVESVNFTDDWHHALISNAEMVSLERINPNLKSDEKSSWHSASTQSGYATPGRTNSQFLSAEAQNASFWLSTETLSPNNDGFNDVVTINYAVPQGSMLTLRVFSLNGLEQKVLADNELTQPNGILIWDGTTHSGSLAATGIYILLANWFTPDGQTGNAKLNIAVSR